MHPKPAIPVDTRFRMSELGAARCPRLAKRTGVVIGGSRNPRTIHVQFDGNATATALHQNYVEPIGLAQKANS